VVVFDVPLFFPELSGVKFRGVALTVLMPNFNKGAYIERSIRSALRQTFPDFELVISDDKSDDLPWITLLPLVNSDARIRFWVNKKRLGTNRNRAKCVCGAHGIWLLSLDSDDELMNRTAEITIKTHRQTGADMSEFRSLQIDSRGRCRVLQCASIPFAQANNDTLIRAFRRGKANWTLWRKMIARSIYEQALLMMGPEICMAILNRGQDKLHCAIMYRFVRKFVRIDVFGYLYYLDIYNNSVRRTPHFSPLSRFIDYLIHKMLIRPLPNFFDFPALRILCDVIQ
jgi:glycosyltransferase involved in cell wall biosynthesis